VTSLIRIVDNKTDRSDVSAFVRGNLNKLKSDLKAKGNTSDTANKYHYEDLVFRIEKALDPK